jgi:hypothetical protein
MVLCRCKQKRELLDKFIEKHNLSIFNNSTPTYRRSNNVLDLILGSSDITTRIDSFLVHDVQLSGW